MKNNLGYHYMKKILATIIIPVYNGERFLKETVQSVLKQHYRPVEIIVVDDGSSDETALIAKSHNEIKYIFQNNQGQTAAMNAGLLAANGKYISFLDADDILLPEKLSRHIDYLDEHQGVDIVMSKMKNFKDPSFESGAAISFKIDESENHTFATATIRKTLFEKIGNFNTLYKHAKEMDWLFRAKEAGAHIEIDQSTVLLRRLHDSNMSYNTEAKSSEYIHALKSSIIRKKTKKIISK